MNLLVNQDAVTHVFTLTDLLGINQPLILANAQEHHQKGLWLTVV